jgi:hypothetical protein
MSITPTTLTRYASVAAMAAGVLFIGVQINHPHLDVTTVTTTEMAVRSTVKVAMAALALVGITGMYLRQVRQTGLLGLLGYVVFGIGYLAIMSSAYVAGYVLPSVAGSDPAYVADVLAAASNGSAQGDIGLMQTALHVQGFGYLAGSLLFGIALYRARVLFRWAAALLAVSGVLSLALALLPDAFYRLLAYPNALALLGLGYSLWRSTQPESATSTSAVVTPELSTAGAQ